MSDQLSAKELQEYVNKGLEALDLPQDPENLYDPITYIIRGGKRLRPLLCLMAYNLFEDNVLKIMPQAIALEVFHNFTLMHDDIMDNAPIRRGMPTVHEKWNANVGILSGDAMLVKAYELMSRTDPNILAGVLGAFNHCALAVCEGQQHDMDFEQQDKINESDYLKMIEQKTATLLGFCLELGGILAGVEEKVSKDLFDIGIHLGMAFQLQDDLLDVYGGDKVGKKVGGDIVNGKKTYLMIKAMELASDQEQKLLLSIKTSSLGPKELISQVISIYDRLNIRKFTNEAISRHISSVHESMSRIGSQRTIVLTNYLNFLAGRSY